MIRIERFTDTMAYYDLVAPFLPKGDAGCKLQLSIAESIKDKKAEPHHVYGGVMKDNEPVLVFSQNTPKMVLSGDRTYTGYLIDYIIKENLTVIGIIAEADLAKDFAELWQEATGQKTVVEEEENIYKPGDLPVEGLDLGDMMVVRFC